MARRNRRNKSQKAYSQTKENKSNESKTDPSASSPTPDGSTTSVDTGEKRTGNDPEWYAKDPYLLRDVGSYPFGYAFGKEFRLDVDRNIYAHSPQHASGWVDPVGVCALKMKPSLGFSDGATSAANVAANSLYAFVRHMNSGRKNYDPSDIFLYLTAIAHLYSFTMWCERIYSIALTYSEQNRYLPVGLLRANGINEDNLRANLANFRAWLNTFINKISVFAVPSNITYFNKTCFMYRDIYIENAVGNIKDQVYMYVPDGFYKFRLDADQIGMLDYEAWDKTNATVQDIITFGENLLNGLFEDEDASLMSGDIFKVYGDNIVHLPSLDEFVALPLAYDPMVLWQMKNSTVVSIIRCNNSEVNQSNNNRWDVRHSEWTLDTGRTQKARPGSVFQNNSGLIICCERSQDAAAASGSAFVCAEAAVPAIAYDKILSSDIPHPEPGVVMESSRNLLGSHQAPVNSGLTDLGWLTNGSYIVTGITIVQHNVAGVNGFQTINGFQMVKDTLTVGNIKYLIQFKYAPMLYEYGISGGQYNYFVPLGDVNNYTIISQEGIKKLHDVAMLSLFYVPGISKIS